MTNTEALAEEIVRCTRQDRFAKATDLCRHIESLLREAFLEAISDAFKKGAAKQGETVHWGLEDAIRAAAYEDSAKIAEESGKGYVYTAETAGIRMAVRNEIAKAIRSRAKELGKP